MKRLGLLAVVGALVLAGALPTWAQAPAPIPGLSPAESQRLRDLIRPNFTVTFGGEMRVLGVVSDNMTDFADTDKPGPVAGTASPRNKDSEAFFFQRWRLFTTVESADKQAKAVWALEVGDLFWGLLGGASGTEFGGTTTRVGPSTGAELGADGVNVETKTLYVQFKLPFIPNANLLFGIHNIQFLASGTGNFVDDDAAGIQFNWRMDPVDLQLWTAKASENARQDADDNDIYTARLGVTVAKDTRATVEGMVVHEQCFARRAVPAGSPAGTAGACVGADFGDTFWVGGTIATKIGALSLDGTVVYGQRQLFSAPLQQTIEEKGWGAQVTARLPIGLVQTSWLARYTTGDENRITGGGCHTLPTPHPLCNPIVGPPALPPGRDFSTRSFSTNLTSDSDKLPIPIAGTSWFTVPFVGEYIFGLPTLGAPGIGGSTHYGDPTGTWTVGGSAIMPLSPALSVGGGVAYIAATEDNGVYGDNAIELDAGALYRLNANLSFQLIAGYVVPEAGDDAWALTFRTRFLF